MFKFGTKFRLKYYKLVNYLKSLRGIKISALGTGFNIEFDWKRRSPSLTSLLERLDEYASERNTYFLIVIDEVQELRFLGGYNKLDFRQIMAYCYDNLRNIKFVLSGSEVGLLYDFLEFDNYTSPLYGRVRDEIVLSRFSKEDSIRFLEVGFNEVGMHPPMNILEEVVNVLNGTPGWLAFYGYKAVQNKRFDVLDRVLEEAIEMASGELNKIIMYGKLYKHILRAVAFDESINFYYKDSLEILEKFGADIHYFSLMKDKDLPYDVGGNYIGGGYPEVYAKELQENYSMQKKIRDLAQEGCPIYAECGGLMYLTKSIDDGNGKKEMVGIFDGETIMTKKLTLSYTKYKVLNDNPVSYKNAILKGHEFHYSMIQNIEEKSNFVYEMIVGKGILNGKDGWLEYNTLGSYSHINFFSNYKIARRFIDSCAKFFKK